MTMTAETKARLRAKAEEVRANKPLAKDYELADWLVMADATCDSLPEYREDYFRPLSNPRDPNSTRDRRGGMTLKYVPVWAIDALAKRVPVVMVRYRAGPNHNRTTPVFPEGFVRKLFGLMGLDVEKYTRSWDGQSVRRCKA